MLARKVSTIRMPALLAVDGDTRSIDEPPSGAEVSRIIRTLDTWLRSGAFRTHQTTRSSGFRFHVAGTSEGACATLVPVLPHTQTDSKHVWDIVNEKASRYRRLVVERDLPLVVVLSAEQRAGLDRQTVEAALRGQNQLSMTFTVGTFGEMEMRPTEMRQTDARPVFDPCLSAVGWLERPGADAHLTLWPMPTADRPIKGPGCERITVDAAASTSAST
jgi:hypothetical protein